MQTNDITIIRVNLTRYLLAVSATDTQIISFQALITHITRICGLRAMKRVARTLMHPRYCMYGHCLGEATLWGYVSD